MAAEIVNISGGRKVEKSKPNQALIDALKDALVMAERGELRSLIGTGFTIDGMRFALWAYSEQFDIYSMTGSLQWLVREYEDRVLDLVKEGSDEPPVSA